MESEKELTHVQKKWKAQRMARHKEISITWRYDAWSLAKLLLSAQGPIVNPRNRVCAFKA